MAEKATSIMELKTMKPGVNLKRKTKMKKIMKNSLWIALGAIALTACSTDGTEDIQPANPTPDTPEAGGGRTITVVASLGDDTKASFTDTEGIRWSVGDVIKWGGSGEVKSEPLTGTDISEDGTKASFTITIPGLDNGDVSGWFVSATGHPTNWNEIEFTKGIDKGYIVEQPRAGEINPGYLFLHSGTGCMTIKQQDGETLPLNLEIAGTILRVIPYTEQYNDESIQYVSFSSNTPVVGTVAYDRATGTYLGVTNVNWMVSKEVHVDLTEHFSLSEAKSAASSKGIYMAVAATKEDAPLDGYQYVVRTDKATYTFSAMDKSLEIKNNVVKNVLLKLENATRVGDDQYFLQYNGTVGQYDGRTFTHEAQQVADCYWVAQIKTQEGTSWENKEASVSENQVFYTNVTFTATDASGAPVDWVRCGYVENNTYWQIELDENKGTEDRTATITATFADLDNYIVTDECRTKTVTITQLGNVSFAATLDKRLNGNVPPAGGTYEVATLGLTFNGETVNDVSSFLQQEGSRYGLNLACEYASATCNENGNIAITFPENKINQTQTYTLQVTYEGSVLAYAEFQQEAGTREPGAFGYTFGPWQGGIANYNLTFSAADTKIEWLAVIGNVSKDRVSYNGQTLSPEDEKALLTQILDWTDEDWGNSFLKFSVDYAVAETKIKVGVEANETGAERKLSGMIWTANWLIPVTTWTITQSAQ